MKTYPDFVMSKMASVVYNEDYFEDNFKKETKNKVAIDDPRSNPVSPKKIHFSVVKRTSDSNFKGMGFNGIIFKDDSKEKYIAAFRGTEITSIGDILTDIAATFGKNLQKNAAIKFIEDFMKEHNVKKEDIVLTGHSLGGILVNDVAKELELRGVSFNSLGNYLWALNEDEKKHLKENVKNINYISSKSKDFLSGMARSLLGRRFAGKVDHVIGEPRGSFDAHRIVSITQAVEYREKLLGKLSPFYGEEEARKIIDKVFELNEKTHHHDGYNVTKNMILDLVTENTKPKFISLEGKTVDEIVNMAKKCPFHLIAVHNRNGFVIENSRIDILKGLPKITEAKLRRNARYINQCLIGRRERIEKERNLEFILRTREKIPQQLKREMNSLLAIGSVIFDNVTFSKKDPNRVINELKRTIGDPKDIDKKVIPMKEMSLASLYRKIDEEDCEIHYAIDRGSCHYYTESRRSSGYKSDKTKEELKEYIAKLYIHFNGEMAYGLEINKINRKIYSPEIKSIIEEDIEQEEVVSPTLNTF